jgi:PPOX class probable F420-dependent enzyme
MDAGMEITGRAAAGRWRAGEAGMADIPGTHLDLLQTDVGILATIGPDGTPQVTAIWFLYDADGKIKLSLNNTRRKLKNLQANPKCTFFILDRKNPQRTLEIRAQAEIIPDREYEFADKVGRKYKADLRTIDPPGQYRYQVVLEPLKVNTHA